MKKRTTINSVNFLIISCLLATFLAILPSCSGSKKNRSEGPESINNELEDEFAGLDSDESDLEEPTNEDDSFFAELEGDESEDSTIEDKNEEDDLFAELEDSEPEGKVTTAKPVSEEDDFYSELEGDDEMLSEPVGSEEDNFYAELGGKNNKPQNEENDFYAELEGKSNKPQNEENDLFAELEDIENGEQPIEEGLVVTNSFYKDIDEIYYPDSEIDDEYEDLFSPKKDKSTAKKLIADKKIVPRKDRGGPHIYASSAPPKIFISKHSLIKASKVASIETVKFLIKSGANINFKNKKGLTPLLTATKNNRPEIVSILINKGADQSIADLEGQKPLQLAKAMNHTRIVAILTTPKREISSEK